MPEFTDKTERIIISGLCAVAVAALIAIGIIIDARLQAAQGAATRRAEHVAIRQVAKSSENQTAGGCERSNITKAVTNRSSLAFYEFLVQQGRAVVAASPDPRIRKLAALDTHLADHQVWQPLIKCRAAVGQGVHYASPLSIYFTKRLPPRQALALPSQGGSRG